MIPNSIFHGDVPDLFVLEDLHFDFTNVVRDQRMYTY